jgi:hypothetical protein
VQGFCELIALEQGMPLVATHLMMIKGHPLMSRLNQAIKNVRGKLKVIKNKYDKLFLQLKCSNHGRFKPLSKFLA